ncbi:MAG: NUDIX domain-containing protein [Bacteroidales bacterium]|nr:NUDIX domain-containing protein [Bacteroidales bacterium]
MQKYKIFTKYHSVCITNQPIEILNVEGKDIIKCNRENFNTLPFYEFLKEVPYKKDIILHVWDLDISRVFIECIKRYVFVQAAGGLVRNPKNELLFIYRNRRWDLPKGHKEHYENIEQTATREVEEECGLKDLVLGEKMGITYHTYYLNGRSEIKETHWYYMRTEMFELIPQKEEGIEKAVWIGEDEIDEVIENCYLSLQDILKEKKLF